MQCLLHFSPPPHTLIWSLNLFDNLKLALAQLFLFSFNLSISSLFTNHQSVVHILWKDINQLLETNELLSFAITKRSNVV